MNTISFIKKNYILIGIILLGAIFRFFKLDFQSIWMDEIHTMIEANPKLSFSGVYDEILAHEQMPPLYFYTIYFLFKIFGYTTFVARLYSAIVGVIGIYAIYLLGKEIFNKRVGIIAAALVCVNYYQIHYSQEVRPYIFLFLFTTLSFYYLIRYIKAPTMKNALIYGAIAALMIYSHFFGLFVLFAQYVTLLLFLLLAENKEKFFINSLVSAILTLVLYSPTIKIFTVVAKIEKFHIPPPAADAFTTFYKDFFGNSEIILAIVSLLIVFYFIKLSKEKNRPITYSSIIENKTVFSFVILLPWIVITILIPLIRSYLSVPMMLTRYFIELLPAIIILLALAINQFDNKIIRNGIICTFIIFSINDLFVVRKFNSGPYKSQFRETTQFIIDNNKQNDPIVTNWGWHFSYFFKNDKVNMTVINKPLEDYIGEMEQNPSMIKSFWYTDAERRPYNLSETAQKFMDDNFIEDNNIDLYDAWAKHYVPISLTPMDLSKYNPLLDKNGDSINFNVEDFTTDSGKMYIRGWAYFPDIISTQSKIELVLINNGKASKTMTKKAKRDDVTTYFKSNVDLSNSGFSVNIDLTKIEKGNYRIGIMMTNKEFGKEGLVLTDKTFSNQ